MSDGFILFDTELGPCGLAWSRRGITELQLPEETREETLAGIARRSGAQESLDAPAWVLDAARRVAAVIAGARDDLGDVLVDLSNVPSFHAKVYAAARKIGPGMTTSYGALARKVGITGGARAVGVAMSRNPVPIVVPCHRVLGVDGAARGFSAHGGVHTKAALLAREGVELDLPEVPPQPVRVGAPGFDEAKVRAWLGRRDKALGRVIDRAGPCTLQIDRAQSTWESLCRSIVYQQLSGQSARKIWLRFVALGTGEKLPTPAVVLALGTDSLRAVGLSGAKTVAVRDLAAKCIAGIVPEVEVLESLDDEVIIDRLTVVRGIGRWSVEMFLMFGLGRPDVLPVSDQGVRSGFQWAFRTKELPVPTVITARAERWRPWRSIASWYLWRAVELSRQA